MQAYLRLDVKIKLQEEQDIFKMCSRMLDLKGSMKENFIDFKCEACKKRQAKNRSSTTCLQT